MKKIFLILLIGIFMTSFVSSALDDNIIKYYKLDNTSAGVVDEIAILNGTTNASRGLPGLINNSFEFDGTENIDTNLNQTYDGAFSASLWINSSSATDTTFFGNSDSVSDGGLYVVLRSSSDGKPHLFTRDGGSATISDATYSEGTNISDGTWHHLVLTYDGSNNWGMYIDGNNVTLSDTTGAISSAEHNLTLGSSASNSPFNGRLDEFGMWNRTITALEITQLYNNGIGLTYPFEGNVILDSPINNSEVSGHPSFNATLFPDVSNSYNNTNASLFIYNSSGDLIYTENNIVLGNSSNSTSFTVTNLTVANYTWEVAGFFENGSESQTLYPSSNNSFNYTNIAYISIDNKVDVIEGDIVSFSTIVSALQGRVISSGNLIFNDTYYSATITSLANNEFNVSRSLLIPKVSGLVNVTFFWETFLDNGFSRNSTTNNVSVNLIALDDCSANTVRILNYTLVDEDDQTILNADQNGTIDLTVELFSSDLSTLVVNFSQVYNGTNNASVCISDDIINTSSYSMFTTTQYGADDYQTEWHHIQNQTVDNSSGQINITLFDLLTTRATVFQLTFKDNNFLPVEDAIIQVERSYPGEGVFKAVEAPKTSSKGQTTANLIKDSETYNFVVIKNNTVIARFDNQIPFCDDATIGLCFINLNALVSSGGIFDYNEELGLIYSFVYDRVARLLTFTFTTTSGTTSNVSLHATKFDQIGETVACDTSIVSASGSLTCTVPEALGNGTLYATVLVDGVEKFNQFISLGGEVELGDEGYLIMFFMVLSLALMFVDSKAMTIIGVMMGFLAGSLFYLIQGGILATGSAIIWLIITGVILVWKLNSEGKT